jgi:Family of unknown function (DUF5675)
VILLRVSSGAYATYGVLIDELATGNEPFCTTLELPWADNDPGTSCIPVGTYQCSRYQSPTHGSTFVVGVPNRSYIEFHPGNRPADSKGCILTAHGYGMDVDGKEGVSESRDGFAEFLRRTSGLDTFTLRVVNGVY